MPSARGAHHILSDEDLKLFLHMGDRDHSRHRRFFFIFKDDFSSKRREVFQQGIVGRKWERADAQNLAIRSQSLLYFLVLNEGKDARQDVFAGWSEKWGWVNNSVSDFKSIVQEGFGLFLVCYRDNGLTINFPHRVDVFKSNYLADADQMFLGGCFGKDFKLDRCLHFLTSLFVDDDDEELMMESKNMKLGFDLDSQKSSERRTTRSAREMRPHGRASILNILKVINESLAKFPYLTRNQRLTAEFRDCALGNVFVHGDINDIWRRCPGHLASNGIIMNFGNMTADEFTSFNLLDSGATNRVCRNKDWFVDLRKVSSDPIMPASGATEAKGYGHIFIQTSIHNASIEIKLNIVLYIPNV
ncbi:hypothetical protein LAZ67_10001641 [Cordylochernes scorpioides]|uniref:Retrovirus-related Pol polyprotein from transposon TNT 1-94-like beta-barrel domain-containing protein n=1 Tax=Cordylochernes scorpioides TaxID=51811 RepID=A0ABY6KYQ9_9ARAC|nr:hypothetical protein LAZ67_10001641 [Cordylochernes scorpioides]